MPARDDGDQRATVSLRTVRCQVSATKHEERLQVLQQEGSREAAPESTLQPGQNDQPEGEVESSEETAELAQPSDTERQGKRHLVVGWVIDMLRPQLERLGLSIVVFPHGTVKASFAIVEQKDLADGAQGKTTRCLPVHIRASSFTTNRSGQVSFGGLQGHAGLVALLHMDDTPAYPDFELSDYFWYSLSAAYLFTGRSITSKTISVRAGARSKYAPYRLLSPDDLVSAMLEYAIRLFRSKKGLPGDAFVMIDGGGALYFRDVLPLPMLQQVTFPTAVNHKKALEAYDAFFGPEGLLTASKLRWLTAERKEGSRSGRFILTCYFYNGPVRLTAAGFQGVLRKGGGVELRTDNGRSSRASFKGPLSSGQVDILVCYTPCLSGIYLVPDFALIQLGVRSTEQVPGRSSIQVRPYGGGLGRSRIWNKFLVDCTAPEEEVFARSGAILTLAAEGKAKGWEAMPLVEDLDLASVTLPLPVAAGSAKN